MQYLFNFINALFIILVASIIILGYSILIIIGLSFFIFLVVPYSIYDSNLSENILSEFGIKSIRDLLSK